MMPIIFVDMDNVLVDFISGLRKLDPKVKSIFDLSNEHRKMIKGKSNFWETLPKMPDCDELWNFVSPLNPRILTAKPIWDDSACGGKWNWIQKNCPVPDYDFYCVPRFNKKIFARTKNYPNILIDDYDKNCSEWESNGGIAIQHKNADETIKSLKTLLNL